jgi:D-alanyl-D-alanine carboxypeptidase
MFALLVRHVSALLIVGIMLTASSAVAQDAKMVELQAAVTAAAQQSQAAAFLDVQGCGMSISAASGVANRVTKLMPTVDMPLRLGSVGKLYTAAVIHRLAARGLLNLDTRASHYLLAEDAVGVANRDATLRQLLNHTSGIPDYYSLPDIRRWNWREPLTPRRVLSAIKDVPATGAPGYAYAYSNSGYQLLGLVAERATSLRFIDLMQSEVLVPLGLRGTRYNVTTPGGSLHGYVGTKDWWESAENTGPDSGITASIADTRTYLRALFVDAGPMRAAGRAMSEPLIETGKPRQQAGAGAEVRVSREGLRLIGHTGDVEGYLSFAYVAPDFGLTMIGHITASDKNAFASLLRTTAQIAKSACAPVSGDHDQLERSAPK